jgi:hypothetical protein
MKKKANRLDAIKMIISSKEVGSQEELLQELNREGFELTHPLPRLETTESSQSCKYERQVCICIAE